MTLASVPAIAPQAAQDGPERPCGCDGPPDIVPPELVTVNDVYAELLWQRGELARLAAVADQLAALAVNLAPVAEQLAGGGLGGLLGGLLRR